MKLIIPSTILASSLLISTVAFTDDYVDNYDGTITDHDTNLMWQKCSLGQDYNESTGGCDGKPSKLYWYSALYAVSDGLVNVSSYGYSGWRLPTLNELKSIVDTRYQPTIDPNYFAIDAGRLYWVSSSEPCTGDPLFTHAHIVGFSNGESGSALATNVFSARLVRDAQ